MPDKSFILDLGKLLIAAAWADGKLTNEEINALKELLFSLEDISGDDWKILEMYMDSPVSEQERKTLLDRLLVQIKTAKDKLRQQIFLRLIIAYSAACFLLVCRL